MCPATCSATGDPHYRTFDGTFYSFMGKCQYVLAKDCVDNKFSVLVSNVPCGSDSTVSCTKSSTVYLGGTVISLARGGITRVNNSDVNFYPFITSGIDIIQGHKLLPFDGTRGIRVHTVFAVVEKAFAFT